MKKSTTTQLKLNFEDFEGEVEAENKSGDKIESQNRVDYSFNDRLNRRELPKEEGVYKRIIKRAQHI